MSYTIEAPKKKSKPLVTTEQIDKFAVEILIDAVTHCVILPPLYVFDELIGQYRKVAGKTKPEAKAVLTRALVRGALLDAFVDWLDDDSIFADNLMLEVIASPALLLGNGKESDSVLERKIGNGVPVFASLEKWLSDEHDVGDVQEVASTLADTVRERLSNLAKVRHTSTSRRSIRKSNSAAIASLFAGQSTVPDRTPLKSLLPYKDGLRIDILAFMLRESLNQQRDVLPAESSLFRILQGQDPVTSSNSSVRNPDHYQPIRACNTFQSLIEDSFNGRDLLHDDFTLSNILVLLGTGQGHVTKRFFDRYLKKRWFTSADQCVQTFEQAHMENPNIVLDNMKCWGTPCSWLAFDQDDEGEPLFRKRLEPMFSQKVVDLWRVFRSREDRTYDDALQLAKDVGIVGFATGITRMQFANTFALLTLCPGPDCDAMARLVRINIRMGAFEGLQRLGLKVHSSSSELEVRDALRCVYDSLDNKLSSDDKRMLRFNAIFVEHLMCKVSRWEKMFPKKTRKTLRYMAEMATKKGEFESIQKDHHAFPFNPRVDRKQLQEWIKTERDRSGFS